MPKIRRARSLSPERSRTRPYPLSQSHSESSKTVYSSESALDVKEWEQTRCPICLEHPHNAVLLKCSSHEGGCKPYMCNTSRRHSNCFEQFCKLYGPIPLITELQGIPFTNVATHRQMDECPSAVENGFGGNRLASKLICPFCRGGIHGYMVVEHARLHMNSKVRSCSFETCDFSGTYSELRKHARSEHPNVRPLEVDPVRRRDWLRSLREQDFEDVLSLVQSDNVVDSDDDLSISRTIRFWMSSFVTDMYDSLMDLLSDRMLDAWRDLESLQERMENVQRDLNSNVSTGVVNNLPFETIPLFQRAQRQNYRTSQYMPRATRFHGQNQLQRTVGSTSQSRLRWRSQTSYGTYRTYVGSTSHTPEPRRQQLGSVYRNTRNASGLHWRN